MNNTLSLSHEIKQYDGCQPAGVHVCLSCDMVMLLRQVASHRPRNLHEVQD